VSICVNGFECGDVCVYAGVSLWHAAWGCCNMAA